MHCDLNHVYIHQHTLVTNSMERSPSWEANSSSASREIRPHFMEHEGCVKSSSHHHVYEIYALLGCYAACWVTTQKIADLEPEGSLAHTLELATCSSPDPDQSGPYPPPHFLYIHFNIILSPMTRYSKWSLSLNFSHQPCMHIFFPPYALYAPPISFFFIWSTE